ncbi:sporulation kinase [Paenibacillus radicis (ex Gao et al. 2016)]|uniref:histidine kinase n=2 Tax=Paenibacillus radicis (ex Gao et al. 2016) TaxID=1737354 RepID=A0A917HDU3_9BACL|nr:sporulation kinase [Paenibacillus radicis (ex Gao et al. 2016)]
MFVIITPRFSYPNYRRKLLFIAILGLLSVIYLGLEQTDPLVYALHLTPISLTLAVLYEGLLPGIATWAAFCIGGIFIMHNDPLTTLISSIALFAAGLLCHYKLEDVSQLRMSLRYFALVCIYLTAYTTITILQGGTFELRTLALIGTANLLSSLFINYIYFHVKHQERFQQELIMSEKYQMIGHLAASISHEIRNPLTTTRGFLQLMGKEGLDRETLNRYRKHAFEGVDLASTIITDYLNFSKPNEEKSLLLDVQMEIDGIMPWLQPYSALSNIEIEIQHLSRERLLIRGESKKLQQCLLNVMKNAIESMPDGGKLTVHTQLVQNSIQILIHDTGAGMDKSQVKRLGKPYFTTKENGTGLGLMVVMSMIKKMNGKILFRSKPNEGTICELHFKRAEL